MGKTRKLRKRRKATVARRLCDAGSSPSKRPPQLKLWSKDEEFPLGYSVPRNYEIRNLAAAQNWRCPCHDQNCLGPERVEATQIYEHRKRFLEVLSMQKGGKRDVLRKLLAEHYSTESRCFSRSF
eukprot:2514705-Pleurochrysis_carterae.AAC.1